MGGAWFPVKRGIAPLVCAVALAGCGGGGAADPPAQKKTPAATSAPAAPAQPLASAESSSQDADYGGLRFDLMSLNRTGDAVVAQIKLTNEAEEQFSIGSNRLGGSWTQTPPGGFDDVSGFALAEPGSRRLYTVLRDSDGACVCTDTDALEHAFLDPGEDITVYAAFPAPPASAQTVTLLTPLGPPLPPVQIQDGEPPALPDTDPPPDIASLTLKDPAILAIDSLADSLDRTKSVAESDREVDIRLSTDVLFALNSARLSPRARAVLRDAADELEKAGAHAVRAEGNADSSGTDEINDPLSRRRAEAVAQALRPLLPGVRFTTRGFGSRRPVASNDTPDGRRRNRRVSLVFARPPESKSTTQEQGGAAPAGEPAAGKSIEVHGADATAGESVTVELESLAGNASLVTMTYKVTNTGDREAHLSSLLGSQLDDTYRFERNSLTGPSLVDTAARERLFVASVHGPEGDLCLCSDAAGANLGVDLLDPGDEGRFYAAYVVSPQTSAVTVELGRREKLPAVAIER